MSSRAVVGFRMLGKRIHKQIDVENLAFSRVPDQGNGALSQTDAQARPRTHYTILK